MKVAKYCTILLITLLAACGGGGGGGGGKTSAPAEVGAQEVSSSPDITWYSTAKPLLDRYCVACHSESGVAPFALETYQQAYGKRSALVYVLESGTMPPAGYAGLTAGESDLLQQWLDAGAPKGDPSQAPRPGTDGSYTYHADARPIIEKHCVNCHEEGGIAPFPLDSYDKVKPVAAAAAFAVEKGSMPPWPPTQGYTRVEHPRVLAAEEEFVLLSWLRGDLAEGSPADYVAPEVEVEANPPVFNLELQMPQAYTPTLRPDDHRCFAIEWPLDETTYVTDVDVIPDQLAEVHHVIVSIAEPEDADLYYAAGGEDGRPGWYCLGAGGVSGAPLPRQIGGWVPGAGRERAPKGTGVEVRPGSVLTVQMHYNTLVADPTPDQSTILVATADQVQRPARGSLLVDPQWLAPGGMPIPAGDPDAHHEMVFPAWALARIFGPAIGVKITDPWVWHSAQLHMHNLGKSGRVTLERNDGTRQVMLDISDWDFNWQGSYRFERELLIHPQDKIHLECRWDNSQKNQPFVDGVQLKTAYVEWGDGTGDEMCLTSLYMTRPLENYDYGYSPSLHIESPSHRQRFAPGDLVPLRLILNNFSLHDPGLHDHNDATQHENEGHGSQSDDHSQVYAGHYHVYLDTDDDTAEHLTAWDDNYYYQLPDNIEPGVHQLRVNLRGPDHHALGIEKTVEFEVTTVPAGDSASLIAVEDWAEQGESSDSLAGHRPTELDCQANSWYEEDGALEVETGYCNYLSLTQPGKTDIKAGDTLHLVLWHGDLAFEQPATAHVAISIGGELVWEQQVEIPTEAEIFDVKVPLDFDAPAGAPVEYHLHNHGYNTWTLLQLEIER
jgi:hypothetical protein